MELSYLAVEMTEAQFDAMCDDADEGSYGMTTVEMGEALGLEVGYCLEEQAMAIGYDPTIEGEELKAVTYGCLCHIGAGHEEFAPYLSALLAIKANK